MAKKNIKKAAKASDVELKIIKGNTKNSSLSKQQLMFNQQAKKIEQLREALRTRIELYDKAMELYGKKIAPLLKKEAELALEFCHCLDQQAMKYKYTKTQRQSIGNVITNILVDTFENRDPDDDAKDLYNRWSDMSYDEMVEDADQMAKEFASDFIKNMSGIDVDLSEETSPNDIFAKLQEKLEEKEKQREEKKSKRKKSKKQIAAELKQKEEENLKLKSVRNIYITLVKALHPDLARTDEELQRNEGLMKQVTVAYAEKDLSTLLKLEMEWVNVQSNNIEKLSEDKLKRYNDVLSEQVQELQRELHVVDLSPRYEIVQPYMGRTINATSRKFNTKVKELNLNILLREESLQQVAKSKKDTIEVVNDIESQFMQNNNVFEQLAQLRAMGGSEDLFGSMFGDMFGNDFPGNKNRD